LTEKRILSEDVIKQLEEDIYLDIERIRDSLQMHTINLDEEVEIAKMKILYLIYQSLKGIEEKLDNIIKQWKN